MGLSKMQEMHHGQACSVANPRVSGISFFAANLVNAGCHTLGKVSECGPEDRCLLERLVTFAFCCLHRV